MTDKNLEHNQSYEWYGTFWFPIDDEQIRYSGKVSYKPGKGIQFSIQEVEPTVEALKRLFRRDRIARKVMHASIHGDTGLAQVTLFNVVIGVRRGNFHTAQFSGSASAMLYGVHCGENDLLELALQYDDHYNNFFSYSGHYEEDAIAYGKGTPLKTEDGWTISFFAASSGTSVYKADDLDSIFWSIKDPELKEVKKALGPILDDNPSGLLKRNGTELHTYLSKSAQDIDTFLNRERIWRSFFEMLINHRISVVRAWGVYEVERDEGETYNDSSPLLCSRFSPPKQEWEAKIIQDLPISYFSIGTKGKNLSDLKPCIDRWSKIHADGDWAPIIDGIVRLMKINDTFGDTSQYSALKDNVETLFDLITGKKGNIDTLANYAASAAWQNKLSAELAFSNNLTTGQHLSSLRNSIAHPVETKNAANGFYSEIKKDPFKLQVAYAYLGALYLKAILIYLDVSDDESREDYCQRFIDLHASYVPIQFE